MGYFDFRVSDQSLIKENCHNSRASNDADMKLGPVTNLTRKKWQRQKKKDDDIISANCDATVIFPIYVQFGAIGRPNSGCMTYKKLTFSLIVTFNSNHYLTETENRTKKSLMQLSY